MATISKLILASAVLITSSWATTITGEAFDTRTWTAGNSLYDDLGGGNLSVLFGGNPECFWFRGAYDKSTTPSTVWIDHVETLDAGDVTDIKRLDINQNITARDGKIYKIRLMNYGDSGTRGDGVIGHTFYMPDTRYGVKLSISYTIDWPPYSQSRTSTQGLNMLCMFMDCSGIVKLNLSEFIYNNIRNTYSFPVQMSQMFLNCINLKEIIVGSGFAPLILSTNANYSNMFRTETPYTFVDEYGHSVITVKSTSSDANGKPIFGLNFDKALVSRHIPGAATYETSTSKTPYIDFEREIVYVAIPEPIVEESEPVIDEPVEEADDSDLTHVANLERGVLITDGTYTTIGGRYVVNVADYNTTVEASEIPSSDYSKAITAEVRGSLVGTPDKVGVINGPVDRVHEGMKWTAVGTGDSAGYAINVGDRGLIKYVVADGLRENYSDSDTPRLYRDMSDGTSKLEASDTAYLTSNVESDVYGSVEGELAESAVKVISDGSKPGVLPGKTFVIDNSEDVDGKIDAKMSNKPTGEVSTGVNYTGATALLIKTGIHSMTIDGDNCETLDIPLTVGESNGTTGTVTITKTESLPNETITVNRGSALKLGTVDGRQGVVLKQDCTLFDAAALDGLGRINLSNGASISWVKNDQP